MIALILNQEKHNKHSNQLAESKCQTITAFNDNKFERLQISKLINS